MPDAPILFQFQFDKIFTFDFFVVFFTFLFVDIFDTIGTLVGVTTQAGLIREPLKTNDFSILFPVIPNT